MNELSIPNEDQMAEDPKAQEIVRFWVSSGDCHVNLQLGIWADEGKDCDKELLIWANVISDIAQHVANGMHQRFGVDIKEAKSQMTADFLKCMKEQAPGLRGE